MANNRGFDEWDELLIGQWADRQGYTYDGQNPDQFPTDSDLQDADWVQVGIVYPDGSTEWRTFVGGPGWDDWEDFLYDVQDWWDADGTP